LPQSRWRKDIHKELDFGCELAYIWRAMTCWGWVAF